MKILVFILALFSLATLGGCSSGLSSSAHWYRLNWLGIDSTGSSPTELDQQTIQQYEQKYHGAPAVYLNWSFVKEHVGKSPVLTMFEVFESHRLILNPESRKYSTFRLEIDASIQELDSIQLVIVSPGGRRSVFGKNDLRVEPASGDSTVYKFVYPDVQKGSQIRESYLVKTVSEKSHWTSGHHIPLQFDIPADSVHFSYVYPINWWLRFKRRSSDANIDPVITFDTASNGHIFDTLLVDVPAVSDEPYTPRDRSAYDFLRFHVTGHTSYTRPWTWGAITNGVRWGSATVARMREDPQIVTIAQEAVVNAVNFEDTCTAIVFWVQDNIEKGHCYGCTYNEVLERGVGSLYVINEITMAMMHAVGLKSEAMLIHPASHGFFDEDFVDLSELTTPVVAAMNSSDTVVCIPYIKHLPSGVLPVDLQGRPAILVEKNGDAEIGRVPEPIAHRNTKEEEYSLTIDENGLIKVEEKKYFRGLSAYLMRSALREAKDSEMEDFMAELLTYDEGDVKLGEYNIENMDDYRQPLVITLNYTIDNLVTVTPEEVIFQTGGLFSPSSERKIKIETDDRVNPIRIYADEEVIKRITINHPPEWALDTKLKPVKFDNQFGELDATYTSESGRFTAEQRRLLKKASEPKEKIDDLMMITSRRSQLSIPTLIFTVKEM